MSFLSRWRRCALPAAVVLIALAFPLAVQAVDKTENDDTVYHSPDGTAPPVAPPVKKGSPLDHLANDPKQDTPTVGYREGHTTDPVYFVGHRYVDPAGGSGWGWIRPNGQGWSEGKWVALQETPGLAVAPFRKLFHHEDDNNWEYKMWGKFATYKAYDPHLDEQVPVFVLQGYEVVGQGTELPLKVGPPGRPQSRGSGASSRESSPIQSNPGVD